MSFLLVLFGGLLQYAAAAGAVKPNILAIIVDDLGHGDVGFGSRPRGPTFTPHIDSLANAGVILDRHYVYQTCTPSRCSYQSGRLPVHVQQSLTNPEDPQGGIPRNMTGLGSVMKRGGYTTAIVGKWDAGMTSNQSTPEGRGYDTSLIYYSHKNDYFTQVSMQTACSTYSNVVDLWSDGAPAKSLNGTNYEEFMFAEQVLGIINRHDFSASPLFLTYTPHIVHCPLQVPAEQLAKFNLSMDETACSAQTPYIFPGSTAADFRCRSQYTAMLSLLDGIIGNITDALKARGVWDNTLMVLTSDNGGALDIEESGGNNFPLRGGKYSDFEGGIRSAAFASGGYLPSKVQGTVLDGSIHIADWYATFAALANVSASEDPLARLGNLPQPDSVNVWDLLSGANSTSPRYEIPISNFTLIQGDWKVLVGNVDFSSYTGPIYPNSSSGKENVDTTLHCGASGCLFNVLNDPLETQDMASTYPNITSSMVSRLTELKRGFYSNSDTGTDLCPADRTPAGIPCACWMSIHHYGGYFGPFQE